MRTLAIHDMSLKKYLPSQWITNLSREISDDAMSFVRILALFCLLLWHLVVASQHSKKTSNTTIAPNRRWASVPLRHPYDPDSRGPWPKLFGCDYSSIRYCFVDEQASSDQKEYVQRAIARWSSVFFAASVIIEPDPACGQGGTCLCDHPDIMSDTVRIDTASVEHAKTSVGYSYTQEDYMMLPGLGRGASQIDQKWHVITIMHELGVSFRS